jgi:hypothetical protein
MEGAAPVEGGAEGRVTGPEDPLEKGLEAVAPLRRQDAQGPDEFVLHDEDRKEPDDLRLLRAEPEETAEGFEIFPEGGVEGLLVVALLECGPLLGENRAARLGLDLLVREFLEAHRPGKVVVEETFPTEESAAGALGGKPAEEPEGHEVVKIEGPVRIRNRRRGEGLGHAREARVARGAERGGKVGTCGWMRVGPTRMRGCLGENAARGDLEGERRSGRGDRSMGSRECMPARKPEKGDASKVESVIMERLGGL